MGKTIARCSHILMTMDQNQAVEKARQFARTRYTGELDNIVREHEQKKVQMRAQMASHGMVMSGNMIYQNAQIDASQVRAIIESRLEALLEGYELYEVAIDDQMAVNLCDELMQGMNQLVYNCKCPRFGGSAQTGLESQYPRMVAQAVGLSANLVKTQIDRRRLMAKKNEGPTTIYSVQGDNARLNVNSNDNSVNIINTKSPDEFFGAMRQRIEAEVSEGEERKKIVGALASLQAAHGKPSFAHRYTEFIGVVGNHIRIIAPFIPALTAMLEKVLTHVK
jgi:hypothetical protein